MTENPLAMFEDSPVIDAIFLGQPGAAHLMPDVGITAPTQEVWWAKVWFKCEDSNLVYAASLAALIEGITATGGAHQGACTDGCGAPA